MTGCLLGLQCRGPGRKGMLLSEDSVSTAEDGWRRPFDERGDNVDNKCSEIRQSRLGGINGSFVPAMTT